MKTSLAVIFILFGAISLGAIFISPAVAAEPRFGFADLDYGQWDFQQVPPVSRTPSRVNWAEPPVACVEDLVPIKPDRPCLDLSRVPDPRMDWPVGKAPEQLRYWRETKRPLQYCRAVEVERRESKRPGSFPPVALQMAWLQRLATERSVEKTNAIYAASRTYKVPVQILTGALYQESLIAEIGIAPDGSNYSCGIGQFNLVGWCSWANTADAALKTKLGWPAKSVDCEALRKTFVAPFFQIALKNLGSEPLYKMNPRHFSTIKLADVERSLPPANAEVQKLRYQTVMSFVNHCMKAEYGIPVKARELKEIYTRYVPVGLKAQEVAQGSKKSPLVCRQKGSEETYPLQTAWLLAVAAYNAGPSVVDLMSFFNRLDREEVKVPSSFRDFDPRDLVASLFWGGRYNAITDQIDFRTRAGKAMSWSWFRQCVVQRHVARIVQHVLRPNAPWVIDSLEGPGVCSKSTLDPVTGRVIQSGVPLVRQVSPGIK
jgi:hypothetical protein